MHVTGAVKSPGLYRFPGDARVGDAIARAGGATEDGYPEALNLAAHLPDGARITVPTQTEWEKLTAVQPPAPLVTADAADPRHAPALPGVVVPPPASRADLVVVPTSPEQTPAAQTSSTTTSPASSGDEAPARQGPKALPNAQIPLNTATREQLMQLPSVGNVTAERILAYRKEHGKFTVLEELLDVKGIGPKTFAKMRPYLKL